MNGPPNPAPPEGASQSAYQLALQSSRPRWQAMALMLSGLLVSAVVPGIVFCGWLRQSQILWAVAGTTAMLGLCYCIAGWLLARKSAQSDRIEDFLISGTLLMGAALFWVQFAVHPGPIRAITLDFWPSAGTAALMLFAMMVIAHWRGRRLASLPAQSHHEEV